MLTEGPLAVQRDDLVERDDCRDTRRHSVTASTLHTMKYKVVQRDTRHMHRNASVPAAMTASLELTSQA